MVRLATKKDLYKIAFVHRICFPDSFLTQLSKVKLGMTDPIVSFYKQFLNTVPELFHIAEEDGKVVGFCMGYYMDNDKQIQQYIYGNRFKILLRSTILLLLGNKKVWSKLRAYFQRNSSKSEWIIVNHKYEQFGIDQRGDLLSVGVLPEYRGKRYAQNLMNNFLTVMKRNKKVCLLSVETKNLPARKYYERNGFEIYRTRGDNGLTYIRKL